MKTPTARYKKCIVCSAPCSEKIKRCKGCKGGRFCSSVCRDSHVATDVHQQLCQPIQQLEELERAKRVCSVRETSQVKLKHQLTRLVGEKPIVNCWLGGVESNALWDTGAQVSMVDTEWCVENCPEKKILSVDHSIAFDGMLRC